jgi:hypothetical protein
MEKWLARYVKSQYSEWVYPSKHKHLENNVVMLKDSVLILQEAEAVDSGVCALWHVAYNAQSTAASVVIEGLQMHMSTFFGYIKTNSPV